MKNQKNTIQPLQFDNNKDSHFGNQMQVVYSFFREQSSTMLEAEVEIRRRFGKLIRRENICWYFRILKKVGKVQSIGKRVDRYTGFMANVWSANEALFKTNVKQLSLFDGVQQLGEVMNSVSDDEESLMYHIKRRGCHGKQDQ